MLLFSFCYFILYFPLIDVQFTREIGQTPAVAQFTVGNDVSSWNTWRTSEYLFWTSACVLYHGNLSHLLHESPIWLLFLLTSGMWTGKKSCIDGVYNRRISGISYFGIFGRMGYRKFWGVYFWLCEWVLIFYFLSLFDILSLLQEISPAVIPQATKIFVNGCWVGIHRDPDMLVKTLRRLRRRVSIASHKCCV